MHNIDMVDEKDAVGELASIYASLAQSRGKIASVHKIQSKTPRVLVAHMDLYKETMFAKRGLRRYQREMLAVVVSNYNNCLYCVRHHSQALLHFWKDLSKVEGFAEDWKFADLSDKDRALCQFAQQMTTGPAYGSRLLIQEMKTLGIGSESVLDAMNVISYFNYVNRLVLMSGIAIEGDDGAGYRYD